MKKAIIALYHNIIRTNAHAQIKQKLWGNIDISAPPPLQIWGTCLPVPLGSMPMAPSIRNFSFSVPNFMQINYCIILILPDGYQWVKKLAIHIRHLHRKKAKQCCRTRVHPWTRVHIFWTRTWTRTRISWTWTWTLRTRTWTQTLRMKLRWRQFMNSWLTLDKFLWLYFSKLAFFWLPITGKVCFSIPSVIHYLLTYCMCDSPSFVTTVFNVDKFLWLYFSKLAFFWLPSHISP